MSKAVKVIFIDTGNTMRVITKDPVSQKNAQRQIVNLIGTADAPKDLINQLERRYEDYKKSVKETMIQPSERELWTRWMLPEFPREKLEPIAEQLTRLWIAQAGARVPRSDVKSTLVRLCERGYTLGIIANTISETEIPDWLEENGLKQYFNIVVLSSILGIRKPNPEIFLRAARQADIEPYHCAYVGDNPSRDIRGARLAGFKLVVILLEAATLNKEPPKVKDRPDFIIHECCDLLNIFPPL